MALLRQACCLLRKHHTGFQNVLVKLLPVSCRVPLPICTIPKSRMSTYTDYEVSTEEFKYVERLMPINVVPSPPAHESYPTPSGWTPPIDSAKYLPYIVRRTRNHNLPVFFEQRNTRKLTKVRGILGDIWAFEADLKAYLEKKAGKKLYTQVHEVARVVRVKGSFLQETSDFLVEKGF